MDSLEPVANVTTEQGLRQCLAAGGQIEVTCRETPDRRGPSWYGIWTIQSILPTGDRKHLIPARSNTPDGGFKLREFKTTTGLISFLVGCGFREVRFPFVPGETSALKLEETAL